MDRISLFRRIQGFNAEDPNHVEELAADIRRFASRMWFRFAVSAQMSPAEIEALVTRATTLFTGLKYDLYVPLDLFEQILRRCLQDEKQWHDDFHASWRRTFVRRPGSPYNAGASG